VVIDKPNAPDDLVEGDHIAVRARLVGPPEASIPGGYDFSRTAWFQGLGATGKAIGPAVRTGRAGNRSGMRERLSAHVRGRIEGSAGGIAAAFASGDRGGIAAEDEEAMRASGLTHLLSISGLHVTAVVGAAMFLTLRLLALSPWMARHLPLVVVAAAAGAAAGVGYTLLTGSEVPTVRSCVAALLVLVGIAIGRQAFTLRLVATGALVVMALWPEAVVGPSFQLSFAAITSIVALHEWGPMQRMLSPRDEGALAKLGRNLCSLLIMGIAVEAALAPIALYHFHRQGLYGALANIVAIPLTTFVTMPFEALALLFDTVGMGAPFWWVTGASLNLLLWIARTVAHWPGAVAALPAIPVGAFALMVFGGLWLLLWRGRIRALGLPLLGAGALWVVWRSCAAAPAITCGR
jgi:competence protein ComEC